MTAMWWWWAACEGPDDGTAADPEPPEVLPAIGIDPGEDGAGIGYIPCDSVHEVRVVNQDTVDRRIDRLRFRALEGEVRFDPWDVELPQVIRPGRELVVPIRDAGLVPGPTRGTLTVVTDIGSFEGEIQGERTFGESHVERWTVGEPLVDVVLAVDQSVNTVSTHADELADGLPGWLDALSAVADWRLILVNDEDACSEGPVWQEGDAQAAARIGADAFDGGTHRLDEALLQLAAEALAENAPTECNGPFKRPDAQLHVVVLSDEPERSGRDPSFWLDAFHDYADVVVVSGVVDEDGRCNAGDGGYSQAIQATGGASIDLCSSGWGRQLSSLADGVEPQPPSYPLDGGAVPESITVTADGAPADATYDDDTATLTLRDAWPPGTRIEVAWSVPPTCE